MGPRQHVLRKPPLTGDGGRCGRCHGLLPSDTDDVEDVCRCGTDWREWGGGGLRRTGGLARGAGPARRAKLQTRGRFVRKSAPAGKPRPAARRTGATVDVEALVWARAGGCCELCGINLAARARGVAWSIHHRQNRGMGGTRRATVNTAGALMLLCGSATTGCHGRVTTPPRTDPPRWAEDRGLVVSKHVADPALVPVDCRHGRVLLRPDGTVTAAPAAA